MSHPEELTDKIPLDELYPDNLKNLEKFSEEEQVQINSALRFAKIFHGDQKRIAGPLFVVHPIAVAQLLIDAFEADSKAVIAGLLHDTVEDTPATLEDVQGQFGEEVRFIVDGATDVGRGDGQPEIKDKELRRQKTQEKIKEFSKKDERVALVKIADRWHNIVTCHALRKKNQIRMADETLDFFVPLCKSAGFPEFADMMKDAANAVKGRANQP